MEAGEKVGAQCRVIKAPTRCLLVDLQFFGVLSAPHDGLVQPEGVGEAPVDSAEDRGPVPAQPARLRGARTRLESAVLADDGGPDHPLRLRDDVVALEGGEQVPDQKHARARRALKNKGRIGGGGRGFYGPFL